MKRLLIPAFALIMAPAMVSAQNAPTIVGTWHSPGNGCKRADGALTIKPMAMEGEDVTCKFSSVSRTGNTVTWKGVCDDAEGSARQTVTATETVKGLTIRYSPGGNTIDNLQRCPR